MIERRYDVTGMTCAACASAVEREVLAVAGVVTADVNLATEQVRVGYEFLDTIDEASLFERLEAAGYRLSSPQSADSRASAKAAYLSLLWRRFMGSSLLTLPLLYLSMGTMLPHISLPLPEVLSPNHHPLAFAVVQCLLTLPVVYLGRSFYRKGYQAFIKGHPTMDTLIAVGTGAALLQGLGMLLVLATHSQQAMLGHHPDLYFESVAVILTLITLGKYLEERSKGQTSAAIQALIGLRPQTATLWQDGETQPILVADIQVGDCLLVKPGQTVPIDGVVVEGESYLDEAMLTGESLPVRKAVGDTVIGASLNTTGSFIFRATRVGQDTTLSQMIRLVEEAQASKAPIARFADQISAVFVPVVLVMAVLSGVFWYLVAGQSFSFALSISIAVLIIACPCALGLATPTAVMVGTGRGAEQGVLFRSGEALEKLQSVQTLIFDKTGTLTEGKPRVRLITSFSEMTERGLLQLAGSLERQSEHPLGQAIVKAMEEEELAWLDVTQFESFAGLGVKGLVDGQELILGNAKCLQDQGVSTTVADHLAERLGEDGQTPIYLAYAGQLQGLIAVADEIKATSIESVARCRDLGFELVMLTGDNARTANAMAQVLGISQVISDVLPQDKAEQVRQCQAQGKRVAMIGDGINDAPALAQADVGIAIGSGTDVALASADVVLMRSDLTDLIKAMALSRATVTTIKQNLFWAFAYNLIGIPVAMGVLYGFGGPLLNPMLAGAAMSFSSVSVLLNTLRLKRVSLKGKGGCRYD